MTGKLSQKMRRAVAGAVTERAAQTIVCVGTLSRNCPCYTVCFNAQSRFPSPRSKACSAQVEAVKQVVWFASSQVEASASLVPWSAKLPSLPRLPRPAVWTRIPSRPNRKDNFASDLKCFFLYCFICVLSAVLRSQPLNGLVCQSTWHTGRTDSAPKGIQRLQNQTHH